MLFTSVAHAQLPGAPQNVRASIEAETIAPAPGDTVTVAIIMGPKPGWHDYWLNPGDAGTPLELEWKLPPGVTAGPIRAPVPGTLIVSGFMNHIYRDKHAFLVDLKIAPTLQPRQQLDIKVDARWSACSDIVCVPESGILTVDLVAGNGRIAAPERARFDGWRRAMPAPLDSRGSYQLTDGMVSLAIPYPASAKLDGVHFFSMTDGLFDYAARQHVWRKGDRVVIQTKVRCLKIRPAKVDAFTPRLCDDFKRISGVLRIGEDEGLLVELDRGTVATGGEPVSSLGERAGTANSDSTVNFGLILGFSILGGLLLNLMPCVFPILGLKALSLAKLGGDEGAARRDALAYSAGVILSCVALGGLLLALRAGGEEIGWAFQLQEPAFVLLLLLLMVAVSANLAGLFEIGSVGAGDGLTRQSGMAGSFWTGVLAAVVATPCTGPFMAAALGAALLLPVEQALLLFAGLGFGLALPFLLLAYIPAARRMLPKPGPWLNTFRKIMAVPMGLTALALLWLLWRLSGDLGLGVGILAAFALLAVVWEEGRHVRRGNISRTRMLVITGVTIVTVSNLALSQLPAQRTETASQPDLLRSEAFTEERLAEYRAETRNVFVYFTADWCVTCKINEAAALNSEETKRAFAGGAVNVLKGDFTRRDPAIARFLAQHGRSGVPLYLYYPAGGEPVVLPQILTVDTLTGLAK